MDLHAVAPHPPETRTRKTVPLETARTDGNREPGAFFRTSFGTVHAITSGHGPDVLLLHGVTDNAHTWTDVQATLSPVARTHAVDLPGHGLSDIPREPLTAGQMASWVLAYLDAAGITRVPVVGWSMGAAVALSLASIAPHRVSALVLEGAAVLEPPFPIALWPLRFRLLARSMPKLASMKHARRWAMANTFARGFRPSEPVVERYWRAWQVRGRTRYMHALLSTFRTGETTPLLGRLSTPTWIIHGEEDRFVPARIGRALAEFIRDANVRVVRGVGHAPHVERMDVVVDAIRRAAKLPPSPLEAL